MNDRSSTFDPRVAAFLRDEAGAGSPDYLDDILRQTARNRQRPAWTSIERWLPVDILANRPVIGRSVAWRPIGALVALALLLAALLAVTVGSRPRLPEPFGVAANGVIAYGTANGDIHAFDPVDGTQRALISGPTLDETPDFSPDGSSFVFARQVTGSDDWTLMLANADGTSIRALTPPIYPDTNVWSHDSSRIAVVDTSVTPSRLTIYRVDGGAPVDLQPKKAIDRLWWRSGTELVFLGTDGLTYGLYAIGTDGSAPRELLPPTGVGEDWIDPVLSPDGSRIAWTKWVDGLPDIHVLDIASGKVTTPIFEGENQGDGWPSAFSPDGTRFVFSRWDGKENHLAVGSADGGTAVTIGPGYADGTDGATAQFSPDGTKVIARYGFDPEATWLLDPAGGPGERVLSDVRDQATWQRLAP